MTEPRLALHSISSIFAPRNLTTWFLLAFSAGSVNAGAFLACRRFVTHVTGTVTHVGLTGGNLALAVDYAIVLACFVAGAGAGVAAIEGRHHRGKPPLFALPLVIVATLVAGVAIAGRLGVFSPFGETVETGGDFLMLSVLAFAMGLQNATVSSATSGTIRTTHMTGPATDLGVSLATSYFAAGESRLHALKMAGLRAGKLTSFSVGAVVMVKLAAGLQYLAFLLPAVVITGCAAVSFVPRWMGASAPEPSDSAA